MAKNKKSQSRIQETSFMIIAVAVFFILVFLFFLAISLGGIKERFDTSSREGSILLIARLAGSPEFSCSNNRVGCVDADKLLVLKNHVNYSSFWAVDGLKVEKVLIIGNNTKECTLGTYPLCTTFTIIPPKNNTIADWSYVSLCRREYKNGYGYDKCELSRIIIWTQKKA